MLWQGIMCLVFIECKWLIMKSEVESCFSVGPLIIMIMDDSCANSRHIRVKKNEICDSLMRKVLEILAYGDIQKGK